MPAERYFLNASFEPHDHHHLQGQEYHHLIHVMRARKGDSIELVNGQGSLAQATVQEIKKDNASVKIETVFQEAEKPECLILAQALPKSHRLDVIVEKGTELGIDTFWLFAGHFSVKKELFPHHLERIQSVTIAAMKQCGRLTLPTIVIQPPIEHWPMIKTLAFFGDLDEGAPFFDAVWKKQSLPITSPVMFITGPEGGFSDQEVQILKRRGVQGVKLHDHILRTDTASIMAVSLLSHWLLSTSLN
jgi:16S rRNA (uracil1498-N3)-methyltransferase